MCIGKPPDPKPAPPPPDPRQATLAAAAEMRAQQGSRTSASGNILTRLRDEDVASSARKKTLGA